MATRRGAGAPAPRTPATGPARFPLQAPAPAQAPAGRAPVAVGARAAAAAPVGTQAPKVQTPVQPLPAQQPQRVAQGAGAAEAVAAGQAQAAQVQSSVVSSNTQPSTSPAEKGEPLPEIQRDRPLSPTPPRGEPQSLPEIPRETVPTQAGTSATSNEQAAVVKPNLVTNKLEYAIACALHQRKVQIQYNTLYKITLIKLCLFGLFEYLSFINARVQYFILQLKSNKQNIKYSIKSKTDTVSTM